jgi:hypothetical protein
MPPSRHTRKRLCSAGMVYPIHTALSILTSGWHYECTGRTPSHVHSAEGVAQTVGSASASPALIAAATDTQGTTGPFPFRLCEFLLLGHVSSKDLLVDSLKEEFGMWSQFTFFGLEN